jgi:hypothetical protein
MTRSSRLRCVKSRLVVRMAAGRRRSTEDGNTWQISGPRRRAQSSAGARRRDGRNENGSSGGSAVSVSIIGDALHPGCSNAGSDDRAAHHHSRLARPSQALASRPPCNGYPMGSCTRGAAKAKDFISNSRRRAAEQRHELAALHSRTSLARAMNTSDKEIPSDAAVLRLTAM